MIQEIAKFLLLVFGYPFLPMRNPGTSYAPSVWVERERKGTNNLIWLFAWYFGASGIATYLWGSDAGWRAAFLVTIWIVLAFDWKVGLFILALSLLAVSWKLAAVALLVFIAWWLLMLSLYILAMDKWEYDRLIQETGERKKSREAFDCLFGRR